MIDEAAIRLRFEALALDDRVRSCFAAVKALSAGWGETQPLPTPARPRSQAFGKASMANRPIRFTGLTPRPR